MSGDLIRVTIKPAVDPDAFAEVARRIESLARRRRGLRPSRFPRKPIR